MLSGGAITIYKYNMGDECGPAIPEGINICYAGQACPYPPGTPVCWKATKTAKTASSSCIGRPSLNGYDTCYRTVCNWYAANVAAKEMAKTAYRLPTVADIELLKSVAVASSSDANLMSLCGRVNGWQDGALCPATAGCRYSDGSAGCYVDYYHGNDVKSRDGAKMCVANWWVYSPNYFGYEDGYGPFCHARGGADDLPWSTRFIK